MRLEQSWQKKLASQLSTMGFEETDFIWSRVWTKIAQSGLVAAFTLERGSWEVEIEVFYSTVTNKILSEKVVWSETKADDPSALPRLLSWMFERVAAMLVEKAQAASEIAMTGMV